MSRAVSIIVPVHGNVDLTRKCLESVRRHIAPFHDVETIVVDNASSDGTREMLAANDWVRSIPLPRNLGFAAACNLGALSARGDVLLFLNNDAYPASDALAPLLETFDEDAGVVIAGSRLLYDDDSLQHAGIVLLAPDRELWHVHRYQASDYPDAQVRRTYPAVTGAALLVRREWFVSNGGFDTSYLNGYEDVDLCFKAWQGGHRVMYVPSSVFYHIEGATSGRRAQEAQNRELFRARWNDLMDGMPMFERGEIHAIDFMGDIASPTPDSEAGLELLVTLRPHVPVRLVGRKEQTLSRRPDLAPCYDIVHRPDCTLGWLCVPPRGGLRAAVVGEGTDLSGADDETYFLALSAQAEERVRLSYPGASVRRLRIGVDTAGYSPQSKNVRLVEAEFAVLYYINERSGESVISDVGAAVRAIHAAQPGIGLAIFSAMHNDKIAKKCSALGELPPDLPFSVTSIADLKGFVNAAVLCGADAVIVPECSDESPFLALASMSCGRPTVMRHDVAASVGADDRTAKIITASTQLAQALAAIRQDDRQGAQIGTAGRADVVRRCSASAMGSRVAEHLRCVRHGKRDAAGAAVHA